jgi:hypothetical protein
MGLTDEQIESVELRDLPVKVNGDDILFETNDTFYEIWKDHITEVGFELSVGKNYVHKNVLTINSQCFIYNNGAFFKIEYLNNGLLTGQSKLSIRRGGDILPLCDWYNIVVSGAIDKVHAHNNFLYYHAERINKLTDDGNYNLFVDPLLGGGGFLPFNQEVTYTHFQRRLAYFLHQKHTGIMTVDQYKKTIFRPLIEDKDIQSMSAVSKKPVLVSLLPLLSDLTPEEQTEIDQYKIKNKILEHTFNFPLWNDTGYVHQESTTGKFDDDPNFLLKYKPSDKLLKEFRTLNEQGLIPEMSEQEIQQRLIPIYTDYGPSEKYYIPWEYIDMDVVEDSDIFNNLFEDNIDLFESNNLQADLETEKEELFKDYTDTYKHIIKKLDLIEEHNIPDTGLNGYAFGINPRVFSMEDYIIAVEVFGADPLLL